MGLLTRTLTTGLVGVTLATGCASLDTYPPALPATQTNVQLPWEHTPLVAVTPPPPELQYRAPSPGRPPAADLLPPPEEWAQWRAYAPPQTICTGKGKRRRCRKEPASAVDQANASAVVKPSAVHTAFGQSILVRYPYDPRGHKVYQVDTSPQEFTRLLLPPNERLATKLTLDPQVWEVLYGKSGAEGARQEVIAVRPAQAPLKGRDMLMLQSGLPIYLQFMATERPGMLSVTWDLPTLPAAPEFPPLDQRPPKFNTVLAYTGYSVTLEGKNGLTPPWMPRAVVDDGKNTLVQFGTTLEGQRMPAVVGVQQNGKPAIVASRLYTRPDQPEHGAWLYVQGLWPALQLKDAAGLSVRIVRQVPVVQEVKYAP